VAAHALVKQHK
jgi:hypothetical protein